jgi:hypothetical protein
MDLTPKQTRILTLLEGECEGLTLSQINKAAGSGFSNKHDWAKGALKALIKEKLIIRRKAPNGDTKFLKVQS